MATASNSITVTIGRDDKSVAFSDALALHETRALSFVFSNGDTWPAGTYTIALSYQKRAQATASCGWSGGALTANINLSTTTLSDLFDILDEPPHVTLDVTLWDEQSGTVWGRGRADVLNTNWTTATASPQPDPPSDFYDGSTAIDSGADSVTVDLTSYGLTVAPRVICTVKGGTNIAATVSAVSATSFTATLSAQTDSESYVLNWVVFP